MGKVTLFVSLLFVVAGGVPIGDAAAAPAPRSDVDWHDSGLLWLDLFVREQPGQDPTPHVTSSVFQRGLGFYEIHTAWWSGTEWVQHHVREGLLEAASAVSDWRPGAGPGDYQIVYAFHGDSDPRELRWGTWDVATNAWGNEHAFGEADVTMPPALAIRNDGSPAVAWYGTPGGLALDTYYARWSEVTPVGVTDLTLVPSCTGGYPTLRLNANDSDFIQVSCRDDKGVGHFDIVHVAGDASVPALAPTVVFGDADADAWQFPSMDLFAGLPVVVAHNADTEETWLRMYFGGAWQAPVLLFTGIPVFGLSVDAVGDFFDGTIGVTALTPGAMRYTQLTWSNGLAALGPTRRVDLEPRKPFAAPPDLLPCEQPLLAPTVRLVEDGSAAMTTWFADGQATVPENDGLVVARFAQFDPNAPLGWNRQLTSQPVRPTSLALDADGDGWTCYYEESISASPEIDLYIRHRDDPPILVLADTGFSGSTFARGCDVAVAPDGRVGVLWQATVAGAGVGPLETVLYRERSGGVWVSPVEPVGDAVLGPVNNDGHLALAFDSWSGAHALVKHHDGVTSNPWLADRDGGWSLQQVDGQAGGLYPDLTYLPDDPDARVSYTLSAFGGTTTYARQSVVPWVYADLVTGVNTFDTSIDSRVIDGVPHIAVGWVNLSTQQIEYAFVDPAHTGGGAPAVQVIEGRPGGKDFVAIEIDAHGEVAASYRWTDPVSGDPLLVSSTMRPFSGGRAVPALPVPGRVNCDWQVSRQGTDLEFDAYDNPRIMHRTLELHPPTAQLIIPALEFVSRP